MDGLAQPDEAITERLPTGGAAVAVVSDVRLGAVLGAAALQKTRPVERVAAVGAARQADEREHLEGLQMESEFYLEPEFWLGSRSLAYGPYVRGRGSFTT
jgi:hypothetical protein